MRSGVSLWFQNAPDWDRFLAHERGEEVSPRPEALSDARVWEDELHLADMVEELGFDALWTVEHHFTPYTMINDPLQFLSYVAGRTKRIDLGTMVVVLPWHDPFLVAEKVSLLWHLLGDSGRTARIGFGRGVGKREFDGLGVSMERTRERFQECLDVVKLAIGQDYFEFSGDFFTYPKQALRPQPRDRQAILDNLYCAWGSPSSVNVAAENGLRPLIIPQRSLDDHRGEILEYQRVRQSQGVEPERPTLSLFVYCADTHEEAERGIDQYIRDYLTTTGHHYELDGDHFQKLKGYEYYKERGASKASGTLDLAGTFVAQHVWGTPDECVAKVRTVCDQFHPEALTFGMKYGAMPIDVAEKSIELFAREALPAIREIEPQPPILLTD